MRIGVFVFLLIFAACGKRHDPVSVQPSLDIPLLPERNLDSLRQEEYPARLLAFAIELGKRNLDLDHRIGMILTLAGETNDWKAAVSAVTERQNYKDAEKSYREYLVRFESVVGESPDLWSEAATQLRTSRERLFDNYDNLNQFDRYPKLAALLDTLIANDVFINSSLRGFEQTYKKKTSP